MSLRPRVAFEATTSEDEADAAPLVAVSSAASVQYGAPPIEGAAPSTSVAADTSAVTIGSSSGTSSGKRENGTSYSARAGAATRFVVGTSCLQNLAHGWCGEAFERENAGSREQGRIDLKRWILGGRTNQRNQAGLDMGQQGILLGGIEAMHLVDE